MDLLLDANNNSSEKSYSLRPRATAKKDDEDSDIEPEREEGLRPSARKKKKTKQKPGKLSKYRRKTANARERSRMREINEAFEALRRAIPHLTPCSENNGEKLTKISTLRLAMKYITALSNALSDSPGESDAESFFSDYSLTPSDPREHSMTPSSISDHSDFYDHFFQKSLTGSISPCEAAGLTPTTELSFPLDDCEVFKKSETFTNLRTCENVSGLNLEPLPSFYQVTSNILSSSELSKRVPSSYQPQGVQLPGPTLRNPHTSSACELQITTPPSEIDNLLYPSLSFDELFIT